MSAGEGAPVAGTWDVVVRTPVGRLAVVLELVRADDGAWTGSAAGRSETVPLEDLRVLPDGGGHRVTWSQSVTRPMRLRLEFEVSVVGASLEGTSRAGRLPRSTVTGARR